MIRLPSYKRILWEGGFKFLLIKQWILHHERVSLLDLLEFISSSRSKRGKSFINAIEENGKYLKVYFKAIKRPLYVPSSLMIEDLYFITDELFNKKHWHYYEIPETRVKEDDIVVDCGAAEGLFSFKVKCRKAYLIEPLPIFIDSLKKTFKRGVTVLPYAVGEKEKEAFLVENGVGSTITFNPNKHESNVIPLKITTIDKLFKNIKYTYLKADLEGSDFDMLLGAQETIKKYKPKIAITLYHRPEHPKQIYNLLKKIVPEYKFKIKGIDKQFGNPVMLHAWI